MKKPKKFSDITVNPECIVELFHITHKVHSGRYGDEIHIVIMCEFCSAEFAEFESGLPRNADWVNAGAKHYFDHHWSILKPFVIEPEPPTTTTPAPIVTHITTSPGLTMPSISTKYGGMIYTTTTKGM